SPPPDPPPAPPARMRVGPAMPNPFSGVLGIRVEVPTDRGSRLRATILDVQGRLVARVYDGTAEGGRIILRWDGSDMAGRAVWCDASEDPAGALGRLQRSGVEVAVALPPHLYYVREKAGAGEVLPAGFGFRGSPGAATDPTLALAPALPLPEPGESDLFFG